MSKCEIKWIDAQGKPTPDENDAIGYAVFLGYAVFHTHDLDGTHDGLRFGATEWRFLICAAHREMLRRFENKLIKFTELTRSLVTSWIYEDGIDG